MYSRTPLDRVVPTMSSRQGLLAVTIAAVLSSGVAPSVSAPRGLLEAEGVKALLDVMDALVELHPEYAERSELLARLPELEREAALDAARRSNETSSEVQAAIRALLDTQTYQIYFRRFTNVTADEVRDLLLDLPYRERRAPGDIGVTLRELLRKREVVRAALDRLLDQADTEWIYRTAQYFAPGWEGELPVMHLIYDSNAGSFAAEGLPFFNVYTGIDLETLGEGPDPSSLHEAEQTMSHELQHVLAEARLYPQTSTERTWQKEWIDQLTRGMIGEGVANLCSPPSGGLKEVYEDPEILAVLVERYNVLLRALLAEEISEEEVEAWYRDNYFDVAIGLLRDHLSKRYAGDELEAKVQASMRYRPDVEHALGWWMVSRIWARDSRREVVAALLEDPFSAYRLYNETLDEERADLRIAPDVLERLEDR